jgi:hypothetical protein
LVSDRDLHAILKALLFVVMVIELLGKHVWAGAQSLAQHWPLDLLGASREASFGPSLAQHLRLAQVRVRICSISPVRLLLRCSLSVLRRWGPSQCSRCGLQLSW